MSCLPEKHDTLVSAQTSQEWDQTPKEVLGTASFDIYKCTVIVFKKKKKKDNLPGQQQTHFKNQPISPTPVQLGFSWAKANGPQLIVWEGHLRMKWRSLEDMVTEESRWVPMPHFEDWNAQESCSVWPEQDWKSFAIFQVFAGVWILLLHLDQGTK